MRNYYLLAMLMASCFVTSAQSDWEIGGGIGITTYMGDIDDLTTNFTLNKTSLTANAHVRRRLGNHAALRLNGTFGQIAGDERLFKEPVWRRERGFSFKSPVLEATLMAELHPLGLYKKPRIRKDSTGKVLPYFKVRANGDTVFLPREWHLKTFSPYLTGGIGGFYSNPTVNWNETNGMNPSETPAEIAMDKSKGKGGIQPSFPFGGGIRVRIGENMVLSGEGLMHYTGYDYLDGISQAGNPKKNDWFFTGVISLSKGLGRKMPDTDGDGIADIQDRCPASAGPRNTGGCPDSDGDGYPDNEDLCPEVAGALRFKGCPDSDKDGVQDSEDACPDVAGSTKFKGCPDKDSDDVPDSEDACPDAAGPIAFKGCPDTDKDGVPDSEDNCPQVKGPKAFRGCPAVDKDNDGMADEEDKCPDMAGLVKWDGCPDSDGDGIPDNLDECPSIQGPEEFGGCPDTDRDGISDQKDKCPTVFGSKDKQGCPEQPGAPSAWAPYKAIYFNSTLQDWQEASKITLEEVVQILKADPSLFARIEGNTDNTGDRPANDLLSEQRAKRCYDYLVSKGISAKRLTFAGFSDKRPIASNQTAQGRQLNRRVEIHFYK